MNVLSPYTTAPSPRFAYRTCSTTLLKTAMMAQSRAGGREAEAEAAAGRLGGGSAPLYALQSNHGTRSQRMSMCEHLLYAKVPGNITGIQRKAGSRVWQTCVHLLVSTHTQGREWRENKAGLVNEDITAGQQLLVTLTSLRGTGPH